METFEDLKFKPHHMGRGVHATLHFPNGYGVSVVLGRDFYSNGIDTFELAMLRNGELYHHKILGHISKEEVTKVMEQIQKLQ